MLLYYSSFQFFYYRLPLNYGIHEGVRLLDEIESYSAELARIKATQADGKARLALLGEVLEREPGKRDHSLRLWNTLPSRDDLANFDMENLLKALESLWDTLKFVKAMRDEKFEPSEQALSTRIFTSEQGEMMNLLQETHHLVKLTYGGGQNGLTSAGREGPSHVSSATSLLRGFESLSEEAVRHFLAHVRDGFAQKVSRVASDVLLIVHEKMPREQLFDVY